MRPSILALGVVLSFGATPCSSQTSLEVASAQVGSFIIERLLEEFAKADPSLLTVYSSGLEDESLAEALTTGRVDVAFVSWISPKLRGNLNGMIFVPVAVLAGRVVVAGPPSSMAKNSEITAIFPASPALEVRAFLTFISSPKGRSTLSEHGAEGLTD